ncbi:UDP-4-amino-4-deoxy-L-arabinose--oxoglutarate aminotransferase [Hydrogenovibrio crunogenus]|uniref:UDP-4-amino-4-deoxy-L-arabinose--oxoglutarate aminotransferase n=1 Tax=Hydrogenovibrio crunogenus TaxID=39765 RepID=A0A4P7P136_9GAMM|nr:DegT/DnrJ/EryC1/StrS family aminotransferase [Hydrogenovibrio crunogenus]QBZ83706.1 UDP-4-amino-4-deoxy-L-arabinose--oxoglutarate aminotransferase [Hydrogenovibrio crunogenus]
MFIPFALPELGEEEIEEVAEALRSGWVTTGPKTKQFETSFSEYIGDGVQTIAVNSATAGLHLALEAIGIGEGDEVITTTHTFTATAEVVRYLGADVKLVDIDPVTMNIDPEAIRKVITPKTKAIMPVHYAGLSCDMDTIFDIADEFGLKIVEDAAHALPTTYKEKLIGSLRSDVTVFSFYANKTMTTGEGGMIVTKSQLLADRMRVMRLHGINRDAFDRFRSEKPAWYYEVVAPGFKYNLTDIASAMGIHQLKRLPKFLKRRQYLAKRYFDALTDLPLILPAKAPEGDIHSWHLYVLRLKENAPMGRDELIQFLADRKIGTSVHYVPLHRHPYWRDRYNLTAEMFPQSDKAYQAMLSIPLYTAMSDEQQDRVISALREALL